MSEGSPPCDPPFSSDQSKAKQIIPKCQFWVFWLTRTNGSLLISRITDGKSWEGFNAKCESSKSRTGKKNTPHLSYKNKSVTSGEELQILCCQLWTLSTHWKTTKRSLFLQVVLFSFSFQTWTLLPLMLTTHFLSYLLQRDHCCSCYWKSKNTSLPAKPQDFSQGRPVQRSKCKKFHAHDILLKHCKKNIVVSGKNTIKWSVRMPVCTMCCSRMS